MISGLTDSYVGFVTYIQQHDPLPTFAIARSRLELEESTMIQQVAREFGHHQELLMPKHQPLLMKRLPNPPPDVTRISILDTTSTTHATTVERKIRKTLLPGTLAAVVGMVLVIAKLPIPHPPLVLDHVLHAPKLIKNLIYVRKFTTYNHVSVEFDPFGFSMKDFQTGMPIMRCESQGELYPITTTNKVVSPVSFASLSSSIWHDRLGHPRAPILDSLRKNKLIKCNKIPYLNSSFCHSCPLGKHVKLPFINSHNSTNMSFDILHSDIWTSPVMSSLAHKYYVLFLDDYSNFLWTFPISNKSQVYSTFQKSRAYIKTQFQREIKYIQCDNSGEYVNGKFQKLCEEKGISFRLSCPHTSPQNGKVERKIRSIINIVRTLLIHASLPSSFWHHALQMATYLLNMLPSKNLHYQSHLKILYQKDPAYSHLRVFGCFCYPLFPSTTIHKLQPRSAPCVFLGYPSNHCGYKCYDISLNKIIICRHVLFNENEFPFSKLHTPSSTSYNFLDIGLSPYMINHLLEETDRHIPAPSPS